MRILLDILYMFRGAYLALLLMGVYQYCFHIPIFRQSGVRQYHKSTFLIGHLMCWMVLIETYWYIIEFLGHSSEQYFQDIYYSLAVVIPPFTYLISHTLRYDVFFSRKFLALNLLPVLLPIIYILTAWRFLLWIELFYGIVFFAIAYLRHNWWYRKHKKLFHETYSNPFEHSTKWYNYVMICFLVQYIVWWIAHLTGEPIVHIFYYVVAIIVYCTIVFQSSRQADHTVILNDIQEEGNEIKSEAERPSKLSPETIANINKQLEKTEKERLYLKHDIDVSVYCKQIGTNHSYFSRYLNQEKGMTFYQYINSMRMLHAQEKLLNSDLSMEEIAYECGYNDIRSFRRAFKENFNINPSEYRDQYR